MLTKPRVKLKYKQLSFFVEKNWDTRELLNGLYDFVTCQRTNGTFYGNGGAACRKGTAAILPDQGNKSGTVSAQSKAIVQALTAAQLEQFEVTDTEQLAANIDTWGKETKAYIEKLKNGEISKEEMDSALEKHLDFDVAKAEFVFIGMENGLNPNNAGAEFGGESAGQYSAAKMLAQRHLIETGQLTQAESSTVAASVEVANRNTVKNEGKLDNKANINEYISSASKLAAEASGRPTAMTIAESDGAYFGGRRMGTIEMSAPAATSISDGGLTRSGGVKTDKYGHKSNDPDRSLYGALMQGQAGSQFTGYSRNYVQKEFAQRRGEYISSELKRAAASPTFQGGFGAPGSGKKFDDFSKAVMDPLAQSGVPVYTTTVKLSTKSNNPNAKQGTSGRTTIAGGRITKEHTVHVADLGNGKYFVAADLSMNAPGYAASGNQYKAYRESIAAVKSGKATKYESTAKASKPKATKAPKPKATKAPKPKTAKAKVAAPAPKKSVGMANWSKSRLQAALDRAYNSGDDAKAAQIRGILGGMS